MSEKEFAGLDDVELPDIPDDADLDATDGEDGADDDEAERDAGSEDEGGGESGGGRFGPILAKVGAVLAPVLAIVGPLVGRVAAPLAAAVAPIQKVTAPAAAVVAPLAARVPRPVAVGLGSFAGVVLVMMLVAGLLSGGQGAAAASVAPEKATVKSSAPVSVAPKAPTKPPYTPTPSGPTATPTPTIWEEKGTSWIAHGAPLPKAQNQQHLLPRHFLRAIDDPAETYTLVTRFSVLTRSGPLAPWWGIVLAYKDESHHLALYFSTDSYNRDKPAAGVMLANGTGARPVGPPVQLPNIDFWGRDTHELRVTVGEKIEAWLNDYPMGTWDNPRQIITGGPKGVFLIGPSKMRFDSIELE